MAHTGERAQSFIDDLRQRPNSASARKIESSKPSPGASSQPWDVGYWAEKQRAALYDFDEEALRPYFPLERVVDGMFQIFGRVLGISRRGGAGRAGLGPAGALLRDSRHRCQQAIPRILLRRLVSAREQARRRVDGRADHRQSRQTRAASGPDLRQSDAAGRRQARAADASRSGDDLPRIRPSAASSVEPRGGAQPGRHQRRLGFCRAAVADHGELVLGARIAGPVRAALGNRRADPRGSVPENEARQDFPRRQRADAAVGLRLRRSGAASRMGRFQRPT